MKHNVSVNATNNLGDDIEYAAFQVAVNGKTFKVMLDDLYSNKIRGVGRELASNAIDAQITAGTQDKPFDIFLPTTMYPEFRIRDYGTGLSHADMMTLYVTLFESTKDDSDDVTGAFGLGSKIPFAYTDSFQVTSYFNGERRVYTANMGDDGLPGIHHIKELRTPTDEPNGLEVSVSVSESDFESFKSELAHLVLAFPTMPNIIGGTGSGFEPITPEFTSEDGSIFAIERRHYDSQFAIKQGCAIYPVSGYYATGISDDYKWTIVFDVPIGTVQVAPDREKLSMTPETKAAVTYAVEHGCRRLLDEVAETLNECKNRREVMKAFTGFTKYVIGKHQIDLSKHSHPKEPWKPSNVVEFSGGSDWEPLKYREGTKRAIETMDAFQIGEHLERSKFVIFNSKAPTTRAALRYKDFAKEEKAAKQNIYKLVDPTPRQIERLVTLLELEPEQLIPVCTLPDPGPPERKAKAEVGVPGVRKHSFESYYRHDAKVPKEIDELPKHFLWYELGRWSNRDQRAVEDRKIARAKHNGILDEDVIVLAFTKGAVERLRPSASTQLDKAIELGEEAVQEEKFVEIVTEKLLNRCSNPAIWEYLGYEGLHSNYKYKNVEASPDVIVRANNEVVSIMAPLVVEYPMLFDVSYVDAVWYIDARNKEKESNS